MVLASMADSRDAIFSSFLCNLALVADNSYSRVSFKFLDSTFILKRMERECVYRVRWLSYLGWGLTCQACLRRLFSCFQVYELLWQVLVGVIGCFALKWHHWSLTVLASPVNLRIFDVNFGMRFEVFVFLIQVSSCPGGVGQWRNVGRDGYDGRQWIGLMFFRILIV